MGWWRAGTQLNSLTCKLQMLQNVSKSMTKTTGQLPGGFQPAITIYNILIINAHLLTSLLCTISDSYVYKNSEETSLFSFDTVNDKHMKDNIC